MIGSTLSHNRSGESVGQNPQRLEEGAASRQRAGSSAPGTKRIDDVKPVEAAAVLHVLRVEGPAPHPGRRRALLGDPARAAGRGPDRGTARHASLAALALENGAPLATTDRDFSRFPKLKLVNPDRNR